jgi:hypothetical protein
MWRSLALVCVLAGTALAQQPQPAQWVRLSLNDGRFVDGYITGGDATSYFVQTSYGYFSLVRTNVIAVTPMGPAPARSPTPPAFAPPATENPYPSKTFGRGLGIAYFAISYGVVVLAASAKSDEDDSARTGYIPLVGPILWAWTDDEDDVGEDGWDWIAAVGTITQGAGLYLALTGGERKKSGPRLTAVSTKRYSGLAVVGSW